MYVLSSYTYNTFISITVKDCFCLLRFQTLRIDRWPFSSPFWHTGATWLLNYSSILLFTHKDNIICLLASQQPPSRAENYLNPEIFTSWWNYKWHKHSELIIKVITGAQADLIDQIKGASMLWAEAAGKRGRWRWDHPVRQPSALSYQRHAWEGALLSPNSCVLPAAAVPGVTLFLTLSSVVRRQKKTEGPRAWSRTQRWLRGVWELLGGKGYTGRKHVSHPRAIQQKMLFTSLCSAWVRKQGWATVLSNQFILCPLYCLYIQMQCTESVPQWCISRASLGLPHSVRFWWQYLQLWVPDLFPMNVFQCLPKTCPFSNGFCQ